MLPIATRHRPEPGAAELDTLNEIAALYYLEQATQQELSQRFAMSRAKIGRLLKRARAEGIVEIRVRPHPSVASTLEKEFQRRFGLDRLLLSMDHRDADAQRGAVASLVAALLNRVLADGMFVAVGMGRNVGAVADNIVSLAPRSVTFVSLMSAALVVNVRGVRKMFFPVLPKVPGVFT